MKFRATSGEGSRDPAVRWELGPGSELGVHLYSVAPASSLGLRLTSLVRGASRKGGLSGNRHDSVDT